MAAVAAFNGPMSAHWNVPQQFWLIGCNCGWHQRRNMTLFGMEVLGLSPGTWTPRCKIARDFQALLTFNDDTQEKCDFIYHRSGALRDTWVVVGDKPWLLKGEPHKPESATRQEWTSWASKSALPLPTVHGYVMCSVQGVQCDFLLMERVAFTSREMICAPHSC